MSHVTGTLEWNDAVFIASKMEHNQLVLQLADGTRRFMNVHNWEASNRITADKVSAIKAGEKVKIATWNGFDSKKWFCDIELA